METNRLEINSEKGYALWAENYDHEKNPLIAVEEPYVEELLKGITYSNVLDAGAVTGEGTQTQGNSGGVVSLRKGDMKWQVTWKIGL